MRDKKCHLAKTNHLQQTIFKANGARHESRRHSMVDATKKKGEDTRMNLFDSYPIRCHLRRVAADQMERGALCDLNEEPRPSFSGCAAAKMFENCMEA